MTIDNQHWCIYNQEDGRLIGNLNLRDAQLIVSFVDPDRLIYFWAWCPEWSEWKSVSLVEEVMNGIDENLFPSEIPTPPKAINASAPGAMPDMKGQKTIAGKSEKTEDPATLRKYKRFDIRLPVSIIVNEQKFETHTRDISLGGIQVEDELPDWVAGYGSLVITLPDDSRSEVICSVVEDQKIGDKFRLEILPSAEFDHLKEWLQKNESPGEGADD